MRYFYDPSSSSSEDERPEAPRKLSSKARGKQRAIQSDQPKRRADSTNGTNDRNNFQTARNRFAFSSDSSSDDGGSSSSSSISSVNDNDTRRNGKDDELQVLSETDSEEEEFPVGPSVRKGGRQLGLYAGYDDPIEEYTTREQKKARLRAQEAHNRDLNALRAIRLNAFARAEREKQKVLDDEVELVRVVLQDFAIRRAADEERVDREFRERNDQRWKEINSAIQQLEKEATAAENARQKQLEAISRAQALREAEERKIAEEKQALDRQAKEAAQRKEKAEADRKENELKQAQEKERIAKEATATPSQQSQVTASTPPSGSGNSLLAGKAQYERWLAIIKTMKADVLPAVSSNPNWSRACRTLKRNISTRISNISASSSDVRAKVTEINALLNDSKSTPETYQWSLNLLSKRIIGMANMNSEADLSPVTFALAQVVVALLIADHAGLADIFMARLVKRCPYIVPYYPLRGSMPLEDYNKLVGRKASEQTVNYNQRMSGIVSLYAAICQTSPAEVPQLLGQPTFQHVSPCLRPEGGWRWLALVLRPPLPLLDVTPLLLYNFLRMSGERFHQLFGRQFLKLVQAIAIQGIDNKAIKWNDGVMGDLSKIRIMLGEWLEGGKVRGANRSLSA